MPEAIIFTGIQASGKSTFYKERFFTTHVRINLDMLKTRPKEKMVLDACLQAKVPFVVDNTNPTPGDREKYIQAAKASGFRVIGYYFRPDIAACMERNKGRSGKERIPEAGLRRTYSLMHPPTYDEGYDEIYLVTMSEEGEFVAESWREDTR